MPSEDAARAFDEAIAEVSPTARRTDTARYGRSGRCVLVEDGRRHPLALRLPAIEQVERGEVRHTKETFGGYWERRLARRRPHLEPGIWTGYEINGRTPIIPAGGAVPDP